MSRQHPQRIPWPESKLADKKLCPGCTVTQLQARRRHCLPLRPQPQCCPQCGWPFLQKYTRRRCQNKEDLED